MYLNSFDPHDSLPIFVEQDVVDRHPARYGAGEYALLLALVLSEIIEAERAVVGVHIVDGVVDAAIGADRQHGPEYLFLHHLHLVGDAADDVERHLVRSEEHTSELQSLMRI